MKHVFSVLFVLIALTALGQSKKELLKDVNDFKIQSIMNANYDVTEANLKTAIENYLSVYGYVKSKNQEDGMLFRKAVVNKRYLSKKAPKGSKEIETKPKYKKNGKLKKQSYETKNMTILSEMRIDIVENEDINQMVSLNENFFPESRMQFLTLRGMMTVEQVYFNLKKHLYVKYKGDKVVIPDDLMSRINAYNGQQKRKGKKLIEGVDF